MALIFGNLDRKNADLMVERVESFFTCGPNEQPRLMRTKN